MTSHTQLISVDKDDIYAVAQTDKVSAFIPAGFQSVLRFSELIAVSGMAPKGLEKPEKVAVAIFHGMEVGLTPMAALQSIAVINGRPSVWGDGALAMVRASGLLDDIEETYEGGDLWLEPPTFDNFGKKTSPGKPNPEFTAVCITTRKGAKRPVRFEFSVMDAMIAGLWNKEGPWQTNPKRMLKMRARGFNLRDEFTDVMRGLVLAEEAQDYGDLRDITPGAETPPESPPDDNDKPKRGRPRKDAAPAAPIGNQYQDQKQDIEDVQTDAPKQATSPKTSDEPKPADVKKPAQQKAEPAQTAPAKSDAGDAANPGDVFLDELLAEVGPNRQLKDHLKYLHNLLSPLTTEDEMKPAWKGRDRYQSTQSEEVFVMKLRDWHKSRVTKPAADAADDEAPPADGGEQVFDFAGFLHELDVKLGACKTQDEVNTVYAEITSPPIKAGVFTQAQIDNDLTPLMVAHLERTDFG